MANYYDLAPISDQAFKEGAFVGNEVWSDASSSFANRFLSDFVGNQRDAASYWTYQELKQDLAQASNSSLYINAGSPKYPNSSVTQAQVVDLICEGPIEGFCDDFGQTIRNYNIVVGKMVNGYKGYTDVHDAARSVFLDNTPVRSKNGQLNFRNFLMDFRPGYANQGPLYFNQTQGRTILINKDLYPTNRSEGNSKTIDALSKLTIDGYKSLEESISTIPHTITDANIGEALVAINIRALSRTVQGKRSSKIKEHYLHFLIKVENEGEDYFVNGDVESSDPESQLTPLWSAGGTGFKYTPKRGGYQIIACQGYVTSDYVFQIRVVLPPNPNNRNRIITVGRIDGIDRNFDDRKQGVAHAQLKSVTELLPFRLNHPHSAMIGVEIDARSYATIPSRKYLLKLQKVQVPSNYIPETKRYEGNWDGQFKYKSNFLDLYKKGTIGEIASSSSKYIRDAAIVVNSSDKTQATLGTGSFGAKGILSFPLAGATPADGKTHGSDKIIRVYDGPAGVDENNLYSADKAPYNNFNIKGGAIEYLPISSFGRNNFTIEFMIKIDTSDLKVIKNANTGATLDANGSSEVRKVIIASDDNSGMGTASIASAASADQIQKVGEALELYNESGQKAFNLQDRIAQNFLDMGVLNQGWRVEVGTEEGVDLGKIFFRSFSTNGITSYIEKQEGGDTFSQIDLDTYGRTLINQQSYTGTIEEFKAEAGLKYRQNGFVDSDDSVLQNGQWHHIAITRNGNTLTLFFDGVAKQATAISASMPGINGIRMFGGKILKDGVELSATGRGEITIGGSKTPIVKLASGEVADSTFVGKLDNIRISLQPEYLAGKTYFEKDGSDVITGAVEVSNNKFPKNSIYTRLLLKFVGAKISDMGGIMQMDSNFFSEQVTNLNDKLLQWTDNPAWIYYDLATNKRYGMAKYGVTESSVDKWSLYKIAKYCDELVKTGFTPKFKERSFSFVDDGPPKDKNDSSPNAHYVDWRTTAVANTSMIKIDGFRNQADFEREFPEGCVVNIYDLNDNKNVAHQKQIHYYRGETGKDGDPYRKVDGSDDSTHLKSYLGNTVNDAGSAVVLLINVISVEDALMLDYSIDEALYMGRSQAFFAGSGSKNRLDSNSLDKEFILAFLFGGGKISPAKPALLKPSTVNKTSTSGTICAELNQDYPFLEPRFRTNIYIDSVTDGLRVLNDIAAVFRGITYYVGGKIVPTCDETKSPVMVFTNSNVQDGAFVYSGTPKDERFTVCKVRYNDEKDFYKQKIEFIEDSNGIIRYGYNEKDLAALGCTSRSQARRLGKWFLYTVQHETESVTFSTGKQAAYLRPGDIVKVLDKNRVSQKNFGRIVAIHDLESRKIKLDTELDLRLIGEKITIEIPQKFETVEGLSFRADHNFVINGQDGILTQKINDEDIDNLRAPQIISFTIKNIEKDTSQVPEENVIVTLENNADSDAFFGKINAGASFSIQRLNETIKVQEDLFKVISVKQNSIEEYELNCIEYNSTKYDSVDFSDDLVRRDQESTPTVSRPTEIIESPKLSLINSNPQERQLLVAWNPVTPTPYIYHVVLYMVGQGAFDDSLADNGDESYDIKTQHRAVGGEDATGTVLPTNVTFNIGTFAGELKVNIWTQDREGRKEIVYF